VHVHVDNATLLAEMIRYAQQSLLYHLFGRLSSQVTLWYHTVKIYATNSNAHSAVIAGAIAKHGQEKFLTHGGNTATPSCLDL
jgi:hypothetical protein